MVLRSAHLRSAHGLSANPMSPSSSLQPVLDLKAASKDVVEGANHRYPAFRNLSLSVFPGERLAVFAVNGSEAKALISCLSGVEPLDGGTLEMAASVSWPLGTNEAFSNKLSGYINARFAAEVYSSPSRIEGDLALIKELSGVPDEIFHSPLSAWPSHSKEALKLAVSLAFEFDVIMVGRISNWDHRGVHPRAVRIRRLFEERILGRTLVMCGNGQSQFALDYCDEGLVLVGGSLIYRGDPEVCLELVKEESKMQKQKRRARVNARIANLLEAEQQDEDQDALLAREEII
jgi:ABC-type polysaccharide/polyol phosphate transport system ATPase subunit